MKNSYKVIVKSNQGNTETTTHDVPAAGSWWGALKIKAQPGARYQLIDNITGQGPDNIRVKRVGPDLRISFEGRDAADLVITRYYDEPETSQGPVVGEVEPGTLHLYVPESGESASLLGNLADGTSSVGMALGSQAVLPSGAAVGGLLAAAGIGPLWAAPLLLLGAAGGGGGGGPDGGASRDVTPPRTPSAGLLSEDDTGFSDSDGLTSDSTPRLLINADADATQAELTLNGKTYTSTTKNAQGQFVVQVPKGDALSHGPHNFSVVVKDAAGNSSPAFTGALTVLSTVLVPTELGFQTMVLSQDTGSLNNDFLTKERALQFSGEVEGFDAKEQKILFQVLKTNGIVVAMAYVMPNAEGQWVFDNRGLELGEVNQTTAYLVKTSVVDLAGRILGSTSQSLVVDKENPVLTYTSAPNSEGTSGQQNFTSISFNATEKGRFTFGPSTLDANSVILDRASFAAGELSLGFTDLAGNPAPTLTNTGQIWTFQDRTAVLTQGASAGDFITLTGPVGLFTLGQSADQLDLSSLYDASPRVGKVAAINQVSATGGGADVISVSMEDVLALGVKNSFTATGHLQVRVDGDASDRVLLDNKLGTSTQFAWSAPSTVTLTAQPYSLYVNTDLGLDLFIQQSLEVTVL